MAVAEGGDLLAGYIDGQVPFHVKVYRTGPRLGPRDDDRSDDALALLHEAVGSVLAKGLE